MSRETKRPFGKYGPLAPRIKFLFLFVTLPAVPSCQTTLSPEFLPHLSPFGPRAIVQEGEVTVQDGEEVQVWYKEPFQSPPRLFIVEYRQSRFYKKPYTKGDLQFGKQLTTYFKIKNDHTEQVFSSWATVKWRAEGLLAEEKAVGTEAGLAHLAQNRSTTQEQIIARVKKIGGIATVNPLLANSPVVSLDLHGSKICDEDLKVLQGFPVS
jgi:hypothetical protein